MLKKIVALAIAAAFGTAAMAQTGAAPVTPLTSCIESPSKLPAHTATV